MADWCDVKGCNELGNWIRDPEGNLHVFCSKHLAENGFCWNCRKLQGKFNENGLCAACAEKLSDENGESDEPDVQKLIVPDDEINVVVALQILGWQEVEINQKKYYKQAWDWDSDSLTDTFWLVDKWSPVTDRSQAWLIIDKVRKARFSTRHQFMRCLESVISTRLAVSVDWIMLYVEPKDICVAALETLQIGKSFEECTE